MLHLIHINTITLTVTLTLTQTFKKTRKLTKILSETQEKEFNFPKNTFSLRIMCLINVLNARYRYHMVHNHNREINRIRSVCTNFFPHTNDKCILTKNKKKMKKNHKL